MRPDVLVLGQAGEAGQPDKAVVRWMAAVQVVQLLRAGGGEGVEEFDLTHHLREPAVGGHEQVRVQPVTGHDDPRLRWW